MPKEWHDRHSVNLMLDEKKRDFYRSIVADRKPYFMRYIYPDLMRQYNTYVNNANKNAIREFGVTLDELQSMRNIDLSDRQREFLWYYNLRMPVGNGNCVMNKICRKIEDEFDGFVSKNSDLSEFDYSALKSEDEYSLSTYYEIRKIHLDYLKKVKSYAVFAKYEKVNAEENSNALTNMKYQFVRDCVQICPDEKKLCNILIDLCYKKNGTKKFVWDICGRQIVSNLLSRNGMRITFPKLCEHGDFEYCGNSYTTETVMIGEDNEYSTK